MPQYQSHKKVWALKIIAVERIKPTIAELERILNGTRSETPGGRLTVEAPFTLLEVSPGYMQKHDPQPGGYYVLYEDGYCSFSPKEAFESGYTRI